VDAGKATEGVLKRQIVLLRGDAANPQQGIAAVERLANQDKVDIFVGAYISAVSNSASDAAARYNKLYWDTNALAQDLTDRRLPNYIRSGPDAFSFGEVSVTGIQKLIAPALNKAPADVSVWIEHEDSIFGSSIAKRQKALLEQSGVKVVGVGQHNYKAVDLTDSILRAQRAKPDVWLSTGYVPDTNLLLKTMRDQGFRPPVIMTVATGDTRETLEALGANSLNGVYVVSYPHPQMSESYAPGAQQYAASYKKKFGTDPIAPQGMTAYVGMKVLLDTVEKAGDMTPEKVKAQASQANMPVKSLATGYGVKFNDTMQNKLALPTIMQWQAGVLKTVFPLEARLAGTQLVNTPNK